jgi:hypothetical protein
LIPLFIDAALGDGGDPQPGFPNATRLKVDCLWFQKRDKDPRFDDLRRFFRELDFSVSICAFDG